MKRAAAIVLATASLLWTCGWAMYLLHYGFTEWVPDDSDGDSTAFAISFLLVVTVIPIGGGMAGCLGASSIRRGSGILTWIGAGVPGLFFFSPGLFGVPYFLSAVLMVAAAILRAQVDDHPPPEWA